MSQKNFNPEWPFSTPVRWWHVSPPEFTENDWKQIKESVDKQVRDEAGDQSISTPTTKRERTAEHD